MNGIFTLALTSQEFVNICCASIIALLFITAVVVTIFSALAKFVGPLLSVIMTTAVVGLSIVGAPAYLVVDHIWWAPKDGRASDWHILTGEQALSIYRECWEDLLAIGSDEQVPPKASRNTN